jgi:hypothetical protein
VNLARFKEPKATYFFSFVEYKPDTKYKQYYIYKYIQTMYSNVGLTEEKKGGRKEGKKDSE